MYEPKIGDFLGELTNDICPKEGYIHLISAGPKNYASKYQLGISTRQS